LTQFLLARAVPYSSEVQQPIHATAVLSTRPQTHYAAPLDRKQGSAGGLHPDADAVTIRLASSSRSQVTVRAASTAACLTWERPSIRVRWRPPLVVAIVTHLVTRSPESSWLTVSARRSSWHLSRLCPRVVVACHCVTPGWNKAGHPLPCGRSSATLLTCVFSSQHFSSYPASSHSDVPSLCPASITSRYDVWSMPGPRARASSSRSQVAARAVSAAARVACGTPSVRVRWRPPLSVAIVTHFVTRSLASLS
jgi:hypothetical protein